MPTRDVLLAELPKGGKKKERWSQGNYTKAIMKEFFEIEPEPGTSQKKEFSWIDQYGALHEETRPFGYRKSRNYGFELGAAVGIPYPADPKRPIAVFRKQTSGSFRYQLLMPNHPNYDQVNDYLQANYSGPKGQRSRITTDVGTASAIWSDSPLWT
jgi:hypothetical protein